MESLSWLLLNERLEENNGSDEGGLPVVVASDGSDRRTKLELAREWLWSIGKLWIPVLRRGSEVTV